MSGAVWARANEAVATAAVVMVSSARTSGRRSAKEGASDAPYRGWKGGVPKTFSDALGAYKSPSPGRANSQVHLPYPKAQCVTLPGGLFYILTPFFADK